MLLVRCTAFRSKLCRYRDLTIKKIPKALLNRCEWGEDDYSLQVENLPKAPPPKGQMELIAEDGDGTTQSRSIGERDLRNEVR